MAKLSCPECDESVDPRGFRQHLQHRHDYAETAARVAFDQARQAADLDGLTETGGAGPSASGEGSGGRRPADVDPEVARLDAQIERARRMAELQQYQSVLNGDGDGGDGDDILEKIAQLQSAGVLAGGDDMRELKQELRRLRQRDRGGDDGQPVEINADGSGAGLLTAAAAAGVDSPEVLAGLAEATPEVRSSEIELQKAKLKHENRREMVDAALEGVSQIAEKASEGVVATAVDAILAGDDDGDDGDGRRDRAEGEVRRAEDPEAQRPEAGAGQAHAPQAEEPGLRTGDIRSPAGADDGPVEAAEPAESAESGPEYEPPARARFRRRQAEGDAEGRGGEDRERRTGVRSDAPDDAADEAEERDASADDDAAPAEAAATDGGES